MEDQKIEGIPGTFHGMETLHDIMPSDAKPEVQQAAIEKLYAALDNLASFGLNANDFLVEPILQRIMNLAVKTKLADTSNKEVLRQCFEIGNNANSLGIRLTTGGSLLNADECRMLKKIMASTLALAHLAGYAGENFGMDCLNALKQSAQKNRSDKL